MKRHEEWWPRKEPGAYRSVRWESGPRWSDPSFFMGTAGEGRCLYARAGVGQIGNFDAPEHIRLAFRAGEPVEPIIDWLIENYGDSHPWLHDLAAAAISSP
jgi:hypothetical protein